MQNLYRKLIKSSLIFLAFLFVSGAAFHFTATNVMAATGFVVEDGKTYYYNSSGKLYKGWLSLEGKKYYFLPSTGEMQKGWMTDSNKNMYYFHPTTGVMLTGWVKAPNGKMRYFNPTTGIMKKGWGTDSSGRKRYFSTSTGYMATGWLKNSQNEYRYFHATTGFMLTGLHTIAGKKYMFDTTTGIMKTGWYAPSKGKLQFFYSNGAMATGWVTAPNDKKRYFHTTNGIMYTGKKTINKKTYYFNVSSGYMLTGWVTISGKQYYFKPSTGAMATGTIKINGVAYVFGSNGVLEGSQVMNSGGLVPQTAGKTIRNYLAGAFQPLGQVLYVWGGGWNDSTRKGLSPAWKKWYDSQSSSYNYRDYNDLSTANRAKGLDCSGFVGWSAYQVMHTESDVGYGYTVVSGEVGPYYKSMGWGTIITQSYLAKTDYKMYPGDIGYNDGHTWIVVGQCADKSVVVIHSTPQAGVQLAGSTTPSGNYDSQAVALATKYMKKFNGTAKYEYKPSCGNYIRNGSYLRWNSKTLSDPDGFKNMTADKILAHLFN